jgi:putative phosphoserine phosphatase/1-acylglycerol-3-phosphate O-acyltransferase
MRLDAVRLARNALGAASLLPAVAGGVALGIWKRDRNLAVNFITTAWSDAALLATGVEFDVEGGQRLRSKRPALFVFNHGNALDLLIITKLVEQSFTLVVNTELAHSSVVTGLGKLLDIVLVDPKDKESVSVAKKRATEAVRRGRSLVIASDSKKWPFRIAMAAGLPVLRVVIDNSADVLSNDGYLLQPGTVHVRVMRPLNTKKWKRKEVAGRIRKLRRSFVKPRKLAPVYSFGESASSSRSTRRSSLPVSL